MRIRVGKWRGSVAGAALLGLCGLLTGCMNLFFPATSVVTPVGPVSYVGLTGNWEFTFTSTQGPLPFTMLSGVLEQEAPDTTGKSSLDAFMQVQQPTNCYVGADLLPLQGNVTGNASTLFSFSFNGQYVSLNATDSSAYTSLSGTYTVGNGCADGYAGTFAGVRYAPISGTYSGVTTPAAQMISLALTQSAVGNADGSTSVSGTANFTGVTCFTNGTVTGSVLGRSFRFAIATNEAGGSQLQVNGTFDVAADTLQATGLTVVGGGCAGSLGTVKLSH